MSDAVDVVSNNEAETSNDMSTTVETEVTRTIENLKDFQHNTGFRYLGDWVIPRAYQDSVQPVHEELNAYIQSWVALESMVSEGMIVDLTLLPERRLDKIKYITQSIDKFMTQLQRCFQNKDRSILTDLGFDRVERVWDPTFGDMTPHDVYMKFKTLTDELKTSLSELSVKLDAIVKEQVHKQNYWIIHHLAMDKFKESRKQSEKETRSSGKCSYNPYLIEFNMI